VRLRVDHYSAYRLEAKPIIQGKRCGIVPAAGEFDELTLTPGAPTE
jgi:hypothetical protein